MYFTFNIKFTSMFWFNQMSLMPRPLFSDQKYQDKRFDCIKTSRALNAKIMPQSFRWRSEYVFSVQLQKLPKSKWDKFQSRWVMYSIRVSYLPDLSIWLNFLENYSKKCMWHLIQRVGYKIDHCQRIQSFKKSDWVNYLRVRINTSP